MKLTRRDFLKGGAVTAAALAVGLKPKAAEPVVMGVGRGGRLFDNLSINGIDLSNNGDLAIEGQFVPAPNVSPEPVQADEDWEEWGKELSRAYASRDGCWPPGYTGGGFLVSPRQMDELLALTEEGS